MYNKRLNPKRTYSVSKNLEMDFHVEEILENT